MTHLGKIIVGNEHTAHEACKNSSLAERMICEGVHPLTLIVAIQQVGYATRNCEEHAQFEPVETHLYWRFADNVQ